MALYVNKLIGVGFYIYFALIVAFGVQTVSKSFLLLLVALCLLFMISLLQNKKHKEFVIVFGCLAVLVFFVATNQIGVFDNLINRIGESFNAGDLTTNRANIWNRYMDYFKENPLSLWFGKGVGASVLGVVPHNTYIDFLYFYGILGTSIFIFVFGLSLGSLRKNKKSIVNFIPLVCVLVNFFFLSYLMYYDLVYILIFVFIVLNSDFTGVEQEKI
jgi:hypothetical protein